MKKVAKIIPLRKLPRSMEVFDYLIPAELQDKLKVGNIVSMPFKNKNIFGLVYEITRQNEFKFKLKQINSIFSDDLLAPYQINLIKWFSDYYHYSLASTALLFAPQIPKRKSEYKRIEEQLKKRKKEKKKNITEPKGKIDKLIKDILESRDLHFLLINQNIDLAHVLYLNLIKTHLLNNEQILILFPTLSELNNLYIKLNNKIRDQVLILDSKSYKSSKNKYLEYYQKIANNQSKVLLGTRSSVFFNLQNVKTIIVDRAEADDYKQWDQNPRYEVSQVLFEMNKFLKSKIIFSGFAPKPKTYYQLQKLNAKLITIGPGLSESQVQRVEFSTGVDNYYLTPSLNKFIKDGLSKNEKILLIVNKRGYASSLKCSNCEHVISCPICSLPLTVYPDNKLFCQHCLKYETAPLKCPKCKGVNLRAVGIGAMGFEHLIKEKYKSENIVVGLPSIYSTEFKKFDRAAFVYFDSLFYLPDFSHSFKAYYMLRKFSQKLMTQNPKVKILLQSNFLENHAVVNFNHPIQNFYKKEFKIRKQLKYPPFSTLLKIIARDKVESKAKQSIEKIYNQIKNIAKAEISEPFPAYSRKIRDFYIWQIAVKVFDKSTEDIIVKKIPNEAVIDKNPLNLL